MRGVKAQIVRTENCTEQIYDQHCHTDFEILFVLAGSIWLNLEGEQLLLRENTGIVIEPLKYHIVTGEKTQYHRLILSFGHEAIPDIISEKFRENIRRHSRIDGSALASALRRFAAVTEAEDPVYEPLREALLIQVLYGLTFENGTAPEEVMDKRSEKLRRVTAFVERNLHREIPLGEIAVEAFMSESSLCHLFRQEMNISLKQYILQKKMTYAKSLLETGTPPGMAAALCGYKNYASFYKIFLKITGVAPGEIARQ